MVKHYDPFDWYWLDEERGAVYSSRRQAEVEPSDAAYRDFLADGNKPTRHPGDAELAAVLAPYGLALKAEDQASFEVDRVMAEVERSPVLAALIEEVAPPGAEKALLAAIRGRVEATLAAKRAAEAGAKAEAEANLAEAREIHRTQQEELRAAAAEPGAQR